MRSRLCMSKERENDNGEERRAIYNKPDYCKEQQLVFVQKQNLNQQHPNKVMPVKE